MRRSALPLALIALLLLLAVDKLRHLGTRPPAPAAPVETGVVAGRRPPVRQVGPAPQPAPATPAGASLTPTLDLYARLAARRLLRQQGPATYLDSLLLTSDSVVRRWPERSSEGIKVFTVPSELPGYRPVMAEFVVAGLQRWTEAGAGVSFRPAADSADADVIVTWVDSLTGEHVGETQLQWSPEGEVAHARVLLALHAADGSALPDDAVRAVAVHEIGHVLGLPHSANPADIMFPQSRSDQLSDRDRQTIGLLYQLPPGSLRVPEAE